MKKKQALSDMGVLAVVAILGVTLFFLVPHFLPKKSGSGGTAPTESSKSNVTVVPSSGAGMGNYTKAYQIGTSKAKAAQAAADDRNG